MLVAEGLHARPVIRAAPVGPVRILVVDDHEVLRSGLRWLLTRVGWVAGCAVAASGEQALELAAVRGVRRRARRRRPRRRVRARRRRAPGAVPIVGLLTSRWDLVSPRTARGAGARGVIAKDRPARALLAAVHELAAGGACERRRARPGRSASQPREREILRLVGAGLTNAEIGAALFLAPGTIKHHMLGLYEKLGAPNRAAAVHAARRLGVLADHRVEEPVTGAPGGARRRVLVADPDDLRRTGLLLALHGGVGARDAERRAGARRAPAAGGRAGGRRGAVPRAERGGRADAAGARRRGGTPRRGLGVVRQWWPAGRVVGGVRRGADGRRCEERGGERLARRRRRRLPARARRPLRARHRRHQPRDRAHARACRRTPSSSTPPRSSASSARATGPRPSASRTTSA